MNPSAVEVPWRSTRLRGPALAALVGLGGLALLRLRDPHSAGSYGVCPSLALTGLPCPGCGGLRAVNDLTHGDVASAVSSNLVAVVLVVLVAAGWARWAVRRWRGRTAPVAPTGPAVTYGVLAAVLLFGVVRNLPFGAALAP